MSLLDVLSKPKARLLPDSMRAAPILDRTAHTPPPTPRHALLVVPFYPKDPHGSFAKHVLTPALSLTSIAAATPPEWTVAYHDENLLQGPPPSSPFPSVVGITVHLTFARRAYELAAWYRSRGARVVLGGLHASACPEEVGRHCDALATGEGVQLWPRILRDATAGRLRERYHGSFTRPYAADPAPRRDVLPDRDFLTTASIIATRGCHNRCDFCHLATHGVRAPYQVRPVDDVAAEVAATGEPYVVFIDNNLGSNKRYLRDLCAAMSPLRVLWSAAVTLDVTDDESLVEAMAAAGCVAVFIGLETLNGENLEDAGKRTPPTDDYARRVEVFHRCGIEVNGSFVFGFDHDRPDVFERTVAFIEDVKLACATFHILTPYPGTPLFERLEDEGRLLHEDWDLYDTAHAVFRPKHMTPRQLEDGYAWCYQRLFGSASIWRRRPAGVTSTAAYLGMSALYKHANGLWPKLIERRMTRAVWRPLLHAARARHLAKTGRLLPAPAQTRLSPVERRSSLAQHAPERLLSI